MQKDIYIFPLDTGALKDDISKIHIYIYKYKFRM